MNRFIVSIHVHCTTVGLELVDDVEAAQGLEMAKDLPKFKARQHDDVLVFISRVLTNKHQPDIAQLYHLIEYADGHYRAIFRSSYFSSPEGEHPPTKSQWNTLKKRLKHHDPQVFVFKEHGEADCEGARCYYIDFGFFANPSPS